LIAPQSAINPPLIAQRVPARGPRSAQRWCRGYLISEALIASRGLIAVRSGGRRRRVRAGSNALATVRKKVRGDAAGVARP